MQLAHGATLAAIATAESPDLILLPTTTHTREFAAMMSMDLNTGVLVDLIGIESTGGKITASRPIYEGKLTETVVCAGTPVIATLRGRAFPRPLQDPSNTGTPRKFAAKTESPTNVVGYEVAEHGR